MSTTEEALKKAMEQKADEVRVRGDALQQLVEEAVRNALGEAYKDHEAGASFRSSSDPADHPPGKSPGFDASPKDTGPSTVWYNKGINTIAANLKLKTGSLKKGVFLFTSSVPGEGTTTISSNVARALAKMNPGNVLLVDCNGHRPGIHKMFRIESTPGLTDILLGKINWEETVRRSNVKNFFVLPFGQSISDSFSLLGREGMERALAAFKTAFEFVVLDTPPVLGNPETEMIAPWVDHVVLVIKANTTRREVVERAIGQIIVQKDILGVIYNQQEFKIPQFLYKRLK